MMRVLGVGLAAALAVALGPLWPPPAEAGTLKSKSKPSQIPSFSELQGITTKVDVIESKSRPGTARLVIYRTNPVGLLIQPDFVVDGRRAGTAQPGGFVMCDLAPGKHSVSVSNIPIALPLSNAPDAITVGLRAGTTTYLRADPQMGIVAGTITLTHVADEQGRADVAGLSRVETDCRGT